MTKDPARRERYFWFSETLGGEYVINVKLGDDHVGASPYTITVEGGDPVNHLAGGRVGLTTAVYKSGTSPPANASDQLGEHVPSAFTAGDELFIDVNLRDEDGNVATIDVANRELLVKYTDTSPTRRAGDGGVVAASATRLFESPSPVSAIAPPRRFPAPEPTPSPSNSTACLCVSPPSTRTRRRACRTSW